VNKDETLAFVSEDAGIVEVIDLVNRVSLEQIAVGNRPVGMVLSSDESELYIGRSGESIAVVNVAQRALVDSINVGTVGSGKLALADDGSTLYAAATKPDGAHTSGSLVQILAIDPAGRTLTDSVQTSKTGDFSGQVVDISVSSPAGKLLVSYQRTAPAELGNLTGFTLVGDLVVISLSSFAVTNEITIGEQAAGFGISPDGSTAYVSGSEDILAGLFRVFVVDLVAGQKLSQLPIAVQSGSEFVFTTAKQAVNTALSLIDLALFGN
jgi:DNA-binding beta-propeller fold protein YncE